MSSRPSSTAARVRHLIEATGRGRSFLPQFERSSICSGARTGDPLMSVQVALFVFLISPAISIVSSFVLAKRIDQVGTWLSLSEGLLGLLTALAADTPEIASAVTAIVGGLPGGTGHVEKCGRCRESAGIPSSVVAQRLRYSPEGHQADHRNGRARSRHRV